MNFKEKYKRFQQWQHNPFHYKNNNHETVICANCGNEVTVNFCPICGQKADVGRVGWKSVHQNIALLWGLESRSLLFTLVQLLLRPGYLINDYISGRRQVSFPPVKMLFIVAIIHGLLNLFIGHDKPEIAPQGFLNQFLDWLDKYPGWGFLCITFFLIFVTLTIFYHAPRNGNHTLPEGFFIQVFMSTIIMLISCFWLFLSAWFAILVPFYYVLTYKQLFGYGLWGSLWRTIVCLYVGFNFFILVIAIIDIILNGHIEHPEILTINISVSVIILTITFFINRKTAKKRNSQDPQS